MHIDRTVGFADWPQTEVVGPTDQHPIEPVHDGLRILPDFVASGFVADRSTDALHSFLRGYRAEVDAAPFELVAGSNGTWTKKVLHSFSGGNDGATRYGEALTLDAGGNVYGTTLNAGLHDYGVIFKLVRGSNGNWTGKVLHAFTGAPDGSASLGGLVFDASGNLFGNSVYSVFELTPGSNGTWTEHVLHTSPADSHGPYPELSLTLYPTAQL